MRAVIPAAFVSVKISTGVPSGIWPNGCDLIKELPFLAGACDAGAFFAGVCARQTRVRANAAKPANRAREFITPILPAAAPAVSAAQTADVDNRGDDDEKHVHA